MPTTSGDAAEGSALARAPKTAQKSLLAPTLFTLFGLALLLSLGTWQVKRLAWKEGLIAERTAAVAAAPIDLPRSLDEALTLEFHRVRAEGTFRHDRELYLHAMTADGTAGYQVITPLVLARGGTLLVDRGFVPEDGKAPGTREAGNPAGPQLVVGLLRLAQAGKPSWFVPDNLPARGEWFSLDIDAMAKASGVTDPLPFTIDADATPNPGGYPVGGQTPLDLPNNHLQYAITWYLIAAGLVVVYLRLVLRRNGSRA